MKFIKYFLLISIAFFSLSSQSSTSRSFGDYIFKKSEGLTIQVPNHQVWDELLKKHVDTKGMVDYEGFIKDKAKLDSYLSTLSNNPPNKSVWSEKEQLAYWINAYNAFTVKLIVDNYPTESIRDLGPNFKIPLVRDVWHYNFFTIGGEEFNLDQIEHGILRKEFNEPRIHFAVNCASFSCPPLLNEAFVVSRLDEQFEKQAVNFINDGIRNKVKKDAIQISSIFSWFSGDFTKNGTLIDFLNKYSKVKIDKNAKISYLDYDWNLNKQ
ncbi:DUF547 domain-containing protein [Algoriphagus sp. SE2]|uniref:DUF547 domain-containing protein n=1 Tax=Algoriphagus sp. SE2 TaxID=3141536 RepID=UPI0031CD00F3